MKWCFAEVFETVAALVPDRFALINGGTRRTWREFEERAARIAGVLRAAGLGPDSKVALYGYNSNEYLEGPRGYARLPRQEPVT